VKTAYDSYTSHPPSHLPLESSHRPEWPKYRNTYGIVLGAERHAQERFAIKPSGREEEYNLLFARVTGFLLIELFNERAILSVEPCASLASEIISPPVAGGTTHDLVFGLGRYFYDYFKRTWHCAFGSSPYCSAPHFSHRSHTRRGLDINYTPFESLLRQHREHDCR